MSEKFYKIQDESIESQVKGFYEVEWIKVNKIKDDKFENDCSTTVANELFKSISNYWNDGSY